MSLIEEEILNVLSEWAEKNMNKHIYPEIHDRKESYYIERKSDKTYMMEYSFYTLEKIKELLGEYSGLDESPEVLKRLVIEVCQNRYRESEGKDKEGNNMKKKVLQDDSKTLPEYIYVF